MSVRVLCTASACMQRTRGRLFSNPKHFRVRVRA
jgi:hypothetical protein